jgi:hypothetical protein
MRDAQGAVVFTIPVENKVFSSGAQYRLTLQAVARTAGKEGGVQFVAHWSFTKDTIVEDCLKVLRPAIHSVAFKCCSECKHVLAHRNMLIPSPFPHLSLSGVAW